MRVGVVPRGGGYVAFLFVQLLAFRDYKTVFTDKVMDGELII